MKDIKISSQTKINPLGKTICLPGSAKTGVLILHGYTGKTTNMLYLGKRIQRAIGSTIYIPRLPGHGTNTEDFCSSTAHDWLRKAYDAYLKLAAEVEEVQIIGLSMGGLLSILISAKFNPQKLVLIAPALFTHSKAVEWAKLLKYFIAKKKFNGKDSRRENNLSEAEVAYEENYHSYHYLAQVAELSKLIKLARNNIHKITIATMLVASITDEEVPEKMINYVENKLGNHLEKKLVYADSPHVINNGPHRKDCALNIIEFLKNF